MLGVDVRLIALDLTGEFHAMNTREDMIELLQHSTGKATTTTTTKIPKMWIEERGQRQQL